MNFSIVDKTLHVACDTPAEVLECLKHYRLDTLAHIDAIATGNLVHVANPGRRDNGEWFSVSTVLDQSWIAPYLARLETLTGYAGPIPPIPAPRYAGGYAVNLCHTHIVSHATMHSHGFEYFGFIESGDWNGKTAANRAGPQFAEYVRAAIGDTKSEPEFLELSNGLMKRNPNYLKRHYPGPRASSALILQGLLEWWLSTHATPGQVEILRQCMANHHTVCPRDSMGAYLLRSYDAGYRVSWGGPLVSFAEFRGA